MMSAGGRPSVYYAITAKGKSVLPKLILEPFTENPLAMSVYFKATNTSIPTLDATTPLLMPTTTDQPPSTLGVIWKKYLSLNPILEVSLTKLTGQTYKP